MISSASRVVKKVSHERVEVHRVSTQLGKREHTIKDTHTTKIFYEEPKKQRTPKKQEPSEVPTETTETSKAPETHKSVKLPEPFPASEASEDPEEEEDDEEDCQERDGFQGSDGEEELPEKHSDPIGESPKKKEDRYKHKEKEEDYRKKHANETFCRLTRQADPDRKWSVFYLDGPNLNTTKYLNEAGFLNAKKLIVPNNSSSFLVMKESPRISAFEGDVSKWLEKTKTKAPRGKFSGVWLDYMCLLKTCAPEAKMFFEYGLLRKRCSFGITVSIRGQVGGCRAVMEELRTFMKKQAEDHKYHMDGACELIDVNVVTLFCILNKKRQDE